MPHADNALVRKLGRFNRLSDGETDCLLQMQKSREMIPARTDLVHEGYPGHHAYVLQEGWAYSYKLLPDGGRQVVSFAIGGDFIGLRSILLRTSDHSFATFSNCVVSPLSAKRLMGVVNEYPRLGAAILWAVSREEAMVVEHLVGIGRRSAIERVAHFFLELGDRLSLVGLATETKFECALNQYLLGDALGLTAIHVNRVLRQLREKRLITVKDQLVTIDDVKGLKKLAGYDSGYLDQSRSLKEIDD